MSIAPPAGIALLTIENPPVNAFSTNVIAALIAQIEVAEADSAIRVLILTGANGTFSGGADMRNFGIEPPPRPHLRDLIDRLEAGTKPTVAALAGNVLGGGLEVALACDHRIATPNARLGFPEILRGLLPGAGGTQRAPRLIGAAAALALIVSGEPIDGTRAKALGLVDALAHGDLLAAALDFATPLAGTQRRRVSAMAALDDAGAIDAARARVEPEARGGLAAQRAIDAVADARLPFAQGLQRERERFVELLGSEQSKARLHLFFAEREAAKLPTGSPAPAFSADNVALIGGGTMGTGIAMACANAGMNVTLIDLEPALLERAREIINGNYARSARGGKLTAALADERLGRIRYATTLEAAAGVDLVIEAVFEELPIKQEVFRALDRIVRPGAILATNTSTLDIDAIAAVTARPADVLGLHFFSPANVMKLLEIVRGRATAAQTIAHALGLARQLKKIPVVAGNCDGFIGNRMLAPYKREADFLAEEGASPQAVDRVIRDFGFSMGPFAMFDLAGIDVSYRVRKRRTAEKPPAGRYSKLEDVLCEMGRFGQKSGAGFYRYEQGSRTPIPDPLVERVIARVAAQAGITARTIGDDEILARCMYPLVNEAAAILADGIAERPGDIDVTYVYGYGFPAFRGGPLRWADTIGLRKIYDEMLAFEQVHGAYWTPAPLLRELALSGGTFGTWKRAGAVRA